MLLPGRVEYTTSLCALLILLKNRPLLFVHLFCVFGDFLQYVTSCARGDTIRLRPLQDDNTFVFIRQVAPVPACWLFKTSATS